MEVVPATVDHIAYVGPRMRASDRREARAMLGECPEVLLLRSRTVSRETWCGLVDGRPVAIWGLGFGPMLSGIGRPWLIGTDEIEQHAVAFLRRNKACIRHWLEITPTLENWVMAGHTTSIRWLGWLGFTIEEPVPFGPYALPFHRFHQVKR